MGLARLSRDVSDDLKLPAPFFEPLGPCPGYGATSGDFTCGTGWENLLLSNSK